MFNLIVYCNQQAVISPYLLSAGLSKRQAKRHRFCVFSTVIASHTGSEGLGKILPPIIISDLSHGRIHHIPLYFCSHRLMKCVEDIYRTAIVNSICILCL